VVDLGLQRPDETDHSQPLWELPTGSEVVLRPLRVDRRLCDGSGVHTVKIRQQLILAAVLSEKDLDQ
jgi:hypothetical protein